MIFMRVVIVTFQRTIQAATFKRGEVQQVVSRCHCLTRNVTASKHLSPDSGRALIGKRTDNTMGSVSVSVTGPVAPLRKQVGVR